MTMNRRPAARGLVLVALMVLLFAAMDTVIHWLGSAVPLLLALTIRYLVQALVMAVWIGLARTQSFRSRHPWFQLLRGLLLLATSVASFIGVQRMPVPEYTAIFLLTPVLVTLLSGALLGEPVSPARWLLVLGAFAGALIVIRPGSGLFGASVAYPLAAACAYAAFQILTRRLAAVENPRATHFWTAAVASALLLPALLARHAPGALLAAWLGYGGWMLLIGLFGTVGHLILILALRLAPPATLMPFVYAQIAAAALLGWLVFSTLPDAWGWVGMAVIAACGASSAWLNLRAPAAAA
ncbi:MAG: DMT family transporter [Burkholderiales bacterium]|nr:DMT family transporter [Burkholderiales bacterium]MDE2457513.1 DMT family transporter [Burkholderiales bacterium]